MNNATDTTTGEPTSVNSTSMLFNATPVVTNFTGANAAAYTITDGAVGSLATPVAVAGQGVQTPSTIAWQPGTSTGSLDVPVPEPDHWHRTACRGSDQRHDRDDFDAAVLSAERVRQPPEPGAAERLSGGLVPLGRLDRSGARARARDHPGLGERARRAGGRPPLPPQSQADADLIDGASQAV